MKRFNHPESAIDALPQSSLPYLFTGSAIEYLSTPNMAIDLKDWQWHEEMIDGRRIAIITDRSGNLL